MGRILLVGEDRERAKGVRSLLRQDSHDVTWTRQVPRWQELERQVRPEVVIATVSDPGTLLEVEGRGPRGFAPPLLFVQHDEWPGTSGLDERLVDRMESPFDVEELLARVDALIRLKRLVSRSGPASEPTEPNRGRGIAGWLGRLAAVMGTRLPRVPKPTAPYLEVVNRVAAWADRRDMFEPGHAERVASLSGMMADALDMPDRDASTLMRAAMLHDIGKVALPRELIRAEGPLREEQLRLIRTHPERGAALIRALDPDDGTVADAIRYHHEHLDGSGYYGKDSEEIPRSARILAVAETYDAMTTSKVRETVSRERALEMLEDRKGSAFDPECVEALVSVLRPRPRFVPLSDLGLPSVPPNITDANHN